MSMRLAINDAANNCAREGARAEITLKSGRQFDGVLAKPSTPGFDTIHMNTQDDGWATIDLDQVAAVRSYRPGGARGRRW